MREFKILTDNTADLPESYIREHDLTLAWLPYLLDGETYTEKNTLDYPSFYAKMRAGSMPTTSQVNPQQAREVLEGVLRQGYDVLYIAFSSGLSGTYNSVRMAAEELSEEYPEATIAVVDSLCASLGEGLLVHKAVQMKEAGKSLGEIREWLEANKLHLCHVFTVDDLNHLYRGGRVSRTAAFLGTLANIKPMLHVDDEGHLIALSKVRGRKKSISKLVDMMEERLGDWKDKNDIIFISHGDCIEDANRLKELVEERTGIQAYLIDYVGPTIGAHSGPGTLALFFMGEKR